MTATIMVPTDGSAESWPAIGYATRLAVSNQAQLVLLMFGGGDAADDQLGLAARRLGSHIATEIVCGEVETTDVITHAARTRRADLLVMGWNAFQEDRSGTQVPLEVARHCPVPLLLSSAPPPCWDAEWRLKPRAVVPLDGSVECEEVLLHLSRLNGVLPCSILMVGLVADGQTEQTEKQSRLHDLADGLTGAGIPTQLRLIGTQDPTAAIRHLAESTYDFIALPVHAHWTNSEGSFGPLTQAGLDALTGSALLVRVGDFLPPDRRGVCPRG